LAPPVRRLYEERQEAFTAGQRWSGIAVLIAGQVRDGTRPHIVENIHKNLFKELIDANIRYHIFAVLEYTRNGFSWRGRKNESRNFNDNDVRRVLERYGNGGNFTLLEWDEDHKQRAEIEMLENCTWRHFHVGERVHALPLQYFKISTALHLMRQAEEKMGTRFALVVRIRPDVTYSQSMGRLLRGRLEEAKGPVNVSVPSMCGAIGGGLGDALLVADRCSAEALHAVAPAVQGCKVVDDCQSWAAVKDACLRSKTLASGGMLQELCGHGWIPTVLRYGVPTTSCGIGGQLGSPV